MNCFRIMFRFIDIFQNTIAKEITETATNTPDKRAVAGVKLGYDFSQEKDFSYKWLSMERYSQNNRVFGSVSQKSAFERGKSGH